MKELTIEQKAQRYDEAIKVAKSNYETIVQMDNDCTFAKEGIVNTFHHMFPELQESKENDDERISKVLIHIVKGACSKYGIKYRGQEISEEKLLALSLNNLTELKDRFGEEYGRTGDCIEWLKSLKERYTWKPSEEILEALYKAIPENVMAMSEDEMLLDKLYQGLKYGRVLSIK